MSVWLVGVLFVVLVLVNVAMTVFPERLPAVLSGERIQALAFWSGWLTAAGACVAGWWWAGQALERSDRDSTRRLRTCFVFALCAVLLLAVATFESDALKRPEFAAVAAALMALLVVPFALTLRELADGGHRRRRRRRSSDDS